MLNTENIKQGKGVEISELPITYFSTGQIAVALGPLDIKTECRWSHKSQMEHQTTIEINYTSVDLCPRDILPTYQLLKHNLGEFHSRFYDHYRFSVSRHQDIPFQEGQSCPKLISYSIPTHDVA
ncbi:hypothetical protein NC653_017160 [Populus alba x Populus x berolinensis]|uniref:Uncharacterized protein n=1 Tax=Populus alba x Populus x berolinensis TaxID=444605 RepID=A0AAD6W039_9ROSI|nr:hypothetical protein NC653_017160 [Populus alba x Populus x berolinensis]